MSSPSANDNVDTTSPFAAMDLIAETDLILLIVLIQFPRCFFADVFSLDTLDARSSDRERSVPAGHQFHFILVERRET
jgi:hypothetical protein